MVVGNRGSGPARWARFLLFPIWMKTLVGHGKDYSSEVQGLRRALDRSYAQMRERALAEWQRRRPANDPSDACVTVRIRGTVRPQPAL